ncbi:hypothetical protein LX14_003336 [Williamsia deligens]|nr:hypothetical protein [Williamsia deligens]
MSAKVEIAVSGNHHPVRVSRSSRRGVDGVLVCQGASWVWLDEEGFESLVDVVDLLMDGDPRLGRVEQFPRPDVVRPSQWQRA